MRWGCVLLFSIVLVVYHVLIYSQGIHFTYLLVAVLVQLVKFRSVVTTDNLGQLSSARSLRINVRLLMDPA